MNGSKILALASLTLISHSAYALVVWPAYNDPSYFTFKDETLQFKLSELPLAASVVTDGGHVPFSDTYWPDDDMGLAVRYMDENEKVTEQKTRSDIAVKAHHYTLAELQNMQATLSPEQFIRIMNALSATEKFDIARGDFNYTLTHRVVDRLNGNAHYAYGICHGWSPSSSNYAEPQKTIYVSKQGIMIPFGSSDVKGLIAHYYAWEAAQLTEKGHANWGYNVNADGTFASTIWKDNPEMQYFEYHQMGSRCSRGVPGFLCNKHTVNPGTFHVILGNIIGKYHRSFEIDAMDPKDPKDIWNYPMLGYSTQVTTRADNGQVIEEKMKPTWRNNFAVKKVLMTTQVWITEVTDPRHEPTNGTIQVNDIPAGLPAALHLTKEQLPGAVGARHFVYYLHLDASGAIVGGDWKTSRTEENDDETNAIGFIWRASRVEFRGDYSILNEIYKPIDNATNVYQGQM